MNVLKALPSIISMCGMYLILLTQIIYTIDEEGVLYIQCKMSLRGPKSMRKLDGLNPVLIDFYVPALTPRLSRSETSLQLSENITLFAVRRIYTGVISKES
jgi:hypothetical protein